MLKQWSKLGIIGVVVLLATSVLVITQVQAAATQQEETPQPITTDQQCLDCHTAPDQILDLPSGESLYVTIDGDAYAAAEHAQSEVGCINCHADITTYPHRPLTAQNLRQVTITYSQTCRECHSDEAAKNLDSIHQKIRDEGNEEAATCADCHNPHYTQPSSQPRSKIATTCGRCHSRLAQEYRASVHGAALIENDDPVVPTCTDCHGIHTITDPRTTEFLLSSPELCAECHANPGIMDSYGLNTNVLETYVADFHGTTVTLFEKHSPDQLPNKPLCIDCHGIHNIKKVTDTESTVIKQNLLTTCQKCHPNATTNFSDAWLSHYEPSPEHNPLVYYVGLFYQFFIPTVIGSMAVMVVADAGRRLIGRFKGGK